MMLDIVSDNINLVDEFIFMVDDDIIDELFEFRKVLCSLRNLYGVIIKIEDGTYGKFS